MNLKQAKRLRKFLRESGIDPRETEYRWHTRNKYDCTVVLDDKCGRFTYQHLKPRGA